MRDTAEQPGRPEAEQPPEDDEYGQTEAKDEEFHGRPDQEAMDTAMADFLKRLEAQEKRNYSGLDEVMSRLPVPKTVDQTGVSVSDAIEAGMLPRMDEAESQRFTPTEVLLYQHAQDHR